MENIDTDLTIGSSFNFSWVGLGVGQYQIERLLGEGAFSWVYEGRHLTKGERVAFKVAKPQGLVGKIDGSATAAFPTRALMQITGAFGNAPVDAADLLQRQYKTLKAAPHANLVRVGPFNSQHPTNYYECEFVDGENLRSIMKSGGAGMTHLKAIANAMASLQSTCNFVHCDLKPENILFGTTGLKLIDPGFVGSLSSESSNVYVTTPSYYPFLDGNDLFAFGVICWEVLVGQHPLYGGFSTDMLPADAKVAPQLVAKVRQMELGCNYFVSPLLKLKRPSEINSTVSVELDELLLRMLGAKFDESGYLAMASVFSNFSEVAQALDKFN